MARKRSTTDYLKAARGNRKFVPSLNKYKGRKDLSRWEKAAITRAENNLRKHKGTLVALTPKQFKRLKGDAKLGDGINAVVMNVAEPNMKIRVGVDKAGNPTVHQTTKAGKKRRWRFIPVVPEPEPLIEEGLAAFDRGADQVFIWNAQGRAGEGARDQKTWAKIAAEMFANYANIKEWILGIATFAQS